MNDDTLFIQCPYCDHELYATVERNKNMAPSAAERWHLRMAKHIRKVHIKTNKKEA